MVDASALEPLIPRARRGRPRRIDSTQLAMAAIATVQAFFESEELSDQARAWRRNPYLVQCDQAGTLWLIDMHSRTPHRLRSGVDFTVEACHTVTADGKIQGVVTREGFLFIDAPRRGEPFARPSAPLARRPSPAGGS